MQLSKLRSAGWAYGEFPSILLVPFSQNKSLDQNFTSYCHRAAFSGTSKHSMARPLTLQSHPLFRSSESLHGRLLRTLEALNEYQSPWQGHGMHIVSVNFITHSSILFTKCYRSGMVGGSRWGIAKVIESHIAKNVIY